MDTIRDHYYPLLDSCSTVREVMQAAYNEEQAPELADLRKKERLPPNEWRLVEEGGEHGQHGLKAHTDLLHPLPVP